MKKVIKILPLLFLLSSLSNLAGSQNIKTFATNYCYTADDFIENVDNLSNSSILGRVHKQYIHGQQGALLTICENSRFQKCFFCIDENQFYSNNHINRYNLLNDCLENKVTIEIIDEKGKKYVETSPPLYFNYSKNDPKDIHYFSGCFTLGDYGIKYIDAETKEVVVPDEKTQSVIVPDEENQKIIVPDEKNQSVIVPDETTQSVIVPDETTQSVKIPDEKNQSVIVPDEKNQSVIVPDEKNQSVIVPDEKNQSVIVPDKKIQKVIIQKIRVPDETTQKVDKNFNMEIGKNYIIKIFVNKHLICAKTVKATDLKKDIKVIECADAKKIYKHHSSVLKQHGGIMLGVHSDNRRVPRIFISTSNINLSNLGANEKFVLEITDKNGKKYINKQFIPFFNDVGNFYFSRILLDFDEKDSRVLFPEKESVDNAFELNTNEQYTIKLKQNNELVMEKQVTAMDLDLMDKKLKIFRSNR